MKCFKCDCSINWQLAGCNGAALVCCGEDVCTCFAPHWDSIHFAWLGKTHEHWWVKQLRWHAVFSPRMLIMRENNLFPWFVWKTSEIEIDQHSYIVKHAGNTTWKHKKPAASWKGGSLFVAKRCLSQNPIINSEIRWWWAIKSKLRTQVGFSKDLSIMLSTNHPVVAGFFPHLCEDAFWSKIGENWSQKFDASGRGSSAPT